MADAMDSDPFAGLSEEERREAERMARIAEEAERRAAERAAARAAAAAVSVEPAAIPVAPTPSVPTGLSKPRLGPAPGLPSNAPTAAANGADRPVYLSKAEREALALKRLEERRAAQNGGAAGAMHDATGRSNGVQQSNAAADSRSQSDMGRQPASADHRDERNGTGRGDRFDDRRDGGRNDRDNGRDRERGRSRSRSRERDRRPAADDRSRYDGRDRYKDWDRSRDLREDLRRDADRAAGATAGGRPAAAAGSGSGDAGGGAGGASHRRDNRPAWMVEAERVKQAPGTGDYGGSSSSSGASTRTGGASTLASGATSASTLIAPSVGGGSSTSSASRITTTTGGASSQASLPSAAAAASSSTAVVVKGSEYAPVYGVNDGYTGITADKRAEIEVAKARYLGHARDESKRRAGKPSEKFAKIFKFDWDATEDTSKDVNVLYSHRLEALPVVFGKGTRGTATGGVIAAPPSAAATGAAGAVAGGRPGVRVGAAAASSFAAAGAGAGGDDRIDRGFRDNRTVPTTAMDVDVADITDLDAGGDGDGEETAASRAARLREEQEEVAAANAEVRRGREREARNAVLDAGSMGLIGRHWSEKRLDEMSERDWRIFREDFNIVVKGGRAVNPIRSWAEADLEEPVQRAVDAMGYKEPTPIQRAAIPMGLKGRDLIGIAETGSGKTAAFLIPLLHYVLSLPAILRSRVAEHGPLAMVMAPTRELAQQIEEECRKISRFTGLNSVAVVGGTSMSEQGLKLRQGVEVVIGTPGRLIDCLENSFLVLHQCRYIVLDEADRMIDLGFEPQVSQVLEAMGGQNAPSADEAAATAGAGAGGGGLGGRQAGYQQHSQNQQHHAGAGAVQAAPSVASSSSSTVGKDEFGRDVDTATVVPQPGSIAAQAAQSRRDDENAESLIPAHRTTHMFTATMPPSVERLAKRFMSQPATVRIGDQESGKNKRILQSVIFVANEKRKREKLMDILRTCPRPVIVFMNAKKACDVIARDIENAGHTAAVLHSGKAQEGREEALASFKAGEAEVLVATDVAGRGLDIPDVAQVINYDMPSDIDRYTHRIGRTGRAGKTGNAVTFLTDDDSGVFVDLKGYLEATGQTVPPDLASKAAAAGRAAGDDEGGGHGGKGGGGGKFGKRG